MADVKRFNSYGTEDDDDFMVAADDYYDDVDEDLGASAAEQDAQKDPEAFSYQCLPQNDFVAHLRSTVKDLSLSLKISYDECFLLVWNCNWSLKAAKEKFQARGDTALVEAHARLPTPPSSQTTQMDAISCNVCFTEIDRSCSVHTSTACGHVFCRQCWLCFIETVVSAATTSAMTCQECDIYVGDSFVTAIMDQLISEEEEKCRVGGTADSEDLQRYRKCQCLYTRYLINAVIAGQGPAAYCVTPDCQFVLSAEVKAPKRVVCNCKAQFCFECSGEYHAPLSCENLSIWNSRCMKESQTARYIIANTKPCPKCKVAIEKSGGCNHMTCRSCHFDFCWVCRGEWKTHGAEYYQCSRYKPDANTESVRAQQAEALQRYFFYYERFHNHQTSLALEERTRSTLQGTISEHIREQDGVSWIDYKHVIDACDLLAKSRYTLQFTYPYAFYLSQGAPERTLLEYQQGQLEREIEELSYMIERMDSSDKAEIQQKCTCVESWRKSLLAKFAP